MKRAPLCLGSVLALLLVACQTADPPEPETNIRLSLNDSLARYETILVQVLDRNDTNRVLATLWNKALPNPATDLPVLPLKEVGGAQSFIVKINGYKARNQLALQTMIFYEPGGKTVRHDAVPPLIPLAYLETLSPSTGSMTPVFHRDSLKYNVTLPTGVTSLTFTVKAPVASAVILVAGAQVASGSASKIIQIGSKPDTVPIAITDSSTGTPVTRIYSVTVIPTLPPGVRLASLVPSAGKLSVDFTPENQVYALYLPVGTDTVTFRVSPVDTRTMTVTVDNVAAIPGASSQVFTVPAGTTKAVGIDVVRAGVDSYYQVTIDHTQTSDH